MVCEVETLDRRRTGGVKLRPTASQASSGIEMEVEILRICQPWSSPISEGKHAEIRRLFSTIPGDFKAMSQFVHALMQVYYGRKQRVALGINYLGARVVRSL